MERETASALKKSSILKQAARSIARALPQPVAEFALRKAALAPPALKSKGFERLCAAIVRNQHFSDSHTIRTNLGIAAHLRCEIPLKKIPYAFGRPENGLPERATIALVRELVRDCSSFVDVGANEGLFTFVAGCQATPKAVQLHWFEPDTDLYDRVARNLQSNSISASANNAAVADSAGTATFYKNVSDDASGSLTNFFSGTHVTKPEPIRTECLSDCFVRNEIQNALLKIDVEGAGSQVWAGARNIIDRIAYIVMEILSPEIDSALPLRVIRDGHLRAYYIRDFELIASSDGSFDYIAPFWNWLFCPLEPDALRERLAGTRFRVSN